MERWKKLSTELVIDTKHFKVRKDIVQLPDGEKKEWVYWDSIDSAMLVGMTEDKRLVMIQQYRYLVDDKVIEFPAGSLMAGETPEQAAAREFEEETGYACANLVRLGSFYETFGQLNRQIHIFFSGEIRKTRQNLDSGEKGHENIKVMLVDVDKAMAMALQNKIVSMGSTLAMLLLKEKILRV